MLKEPKEFAAECKSVYPDDTFLQLRGTILNAWKDNAWPHIGPLFIGEAIDALKEMY